MRIGSLFSGIGGLELGLEWAGVGETVWQVEIDPFCRRVLARHWPDVERFQDVKTFEGLPADLICGGFPCQPFSTASRGRRVAKDLWPEMLRIVDRERPRFVVAENVDDAPIESAAGALRGLGYQAFTFALAASMVGAPHDRPRWFVVAHPNSKSEPLCTIHAKVASVPGLAGIDRWQTEPAGLGVDDGLPYRVDRLRALGNAVVPQCAEVIGHMILELEAA